MSKIGDHLKVALKEAIAKERYGKLLVFLGGSAWAATAISGIPQALQVYHNGHARGINVTMVMLLIYGVACSMTYTYLKYGFDVVLLGKGFFTLLIWGFIGSYLL